MSVTVSELSTFERRLTLTFEGPSLYRAENRAARRISQDLHINGFRRGKAPRRLVENIVGKERLRSEAIESLLNEELPKALADTGLEPAFPPSVNDVRDSEDGVEVDLLVSMWPALDEPPAYEGRRFEMEDPGLDIDNEAIDRALEMYRDQFAELETVERPSRDGDYVAIDLDVSQGDRPVEALSISDFLYEVGVEGLIEGLEDNLAQRQAGDTVYFESTLRYDAGGLEKGAQVEARVTIKEVKEKRLPELDDEWVEDFSEFDTVEELREDVRSELQTGRLETLRGQFRERVVSELVDEVDVAIPPSLIDALVSEFLEGTRSQIEAMGSDWEEVLESFGQNREQFIENQRQRAFHRIRIRALLDAVADHSGLEVDPDELRQAYRGMGSGIDKTAEELAQALAGSVQERALVGDILRSKAVTALLHGAVAVDEDGNAIDLGFEPSAVPEPVEVETAGTEIVQAEIVQAEIVEDEVVEAEIELGDQ